MATDKFQEHSEEFLKWLKSRNYEISQKIGIHDYRGNLQGRGIIALQDIEEDEILFTIPRASVVAVDTDTSGFAEKVPEINDLDTWSALILYLIYQADKDEFRPYFNVVPKSFSTPMFWDEDEAKKLLQGSKVFDKIGKKSAEGLFKEKILPIIENHEDVFKGVDISVDAFHRIGSLIMSYSFDVNNKGSTSDASTENDENLNDVKGEADSLENGNGNRKEEEENDSDEENEDEESELIDEEIDLESDDEDDFPVKAIVPLADTLNAHSVLHNAHLCQEPVGLVMRSTKAIAKGSQVYNTYGDFPNGDLLRRYGYVELGGTESDLVELDMSEIIEAFVKNAPAKTFGGDLKSEDIMKIAEEITEWEQDIMEIVDESYDIPVGGVPGTEFLVFISILTFAVMRSKDYKAFKRSLKRSYNNPEKTVKIFLKAFIKLVTLGKLFDESVPIFTTLIQTRLEKYPADALTYAKTTSDLETNETRVVLSNQGMAQEVLAGEIKILQSTLEWLKSVQTVAIKDYDIPTDEAQNSKKRQREDKTVKGRGKSKSRKS